MAPQQFAVTGPSILPGVLLLLVVIILATNEVLQCRPAAPPGSRPTVNIVVCKCACVTVGQELRGVGGLHSLSNHSNHCLITKAPYTVVKYVDVLMGLHLCEGEGGGSDVDTNVVKSEGATDVQGDSDETLISSLMRCMGGLWREHRCKAPCTHEV